jgi:hypothetical protein
MLNQFVTVENVYSKSIFMTVENVYSKSIFMTVENVCKQESFQPSIIIIVIQKKDETSI